MNFVSNFEESNFELEFEFVFRGTGFDGQSDGSNVSLKNVLGEGFTMIYRRTLFSILQTASHQVNLLQMNLFRYLQRCE